jgi:hypothetical protein
MKRALNAEVFDLASYLKQPNSLKTILHFAHTLCYIFPLPQFSEQLTVISLSRFNDFCRDTMFCERYKLSLQILLDKFQSSEF